MATMEKRVVGVIGGTGLYQIEGLEKVREVEVDTPFGKPSDAYVTGTLDGTDFVFSPATWKRTPIASHGDKFPRQHLWHEKVGGGRDHFRERRRQPF